jgi:Sec-independent protein secretion pathway component TatC
MLLEMAPLVVLYELSILLAKAFGTRAEKLDTAPQGS